MFTTKFTHYRQAIRAGSQSFPYTNIDNYTSRIYYALASARPILVMSPPRGALPGGRLPRPSDRLGPGKDARAARARAGVSPPFPRSYCNKCNLEE